MKWIPVYERLARYHRRRATRHIMRAIEYERFVKFERDLNYLTAEVDRLRASVKVTSKMVDAVLGAERGSSDA